MKRGLFYKLRLAVMTAAAFFLVSAPQLALAADPCPEGVLVSGCVRDMDFKQYLNALLNQLFPFVLVVAIIMIAFSGVQYMVGGVNAENKKKAKTRIVGILVGIVFFLSIGLIIRLILPNSSL